MKNLPTRLKKFWFILGAAVTGLSSASCALTPENAQVFEEDVRSHEQKVVINISTLAQLRAMGGTGDYRLVANINASATHTPGQEFQPIGHDTWYFSGTFDGNGYTISNLKIKPSLFGTGLFTAINDSTIQNVKLTNVSVSGHEHVGGLAGSVVSSTITNCSVTGTVTGIAGMAPRANAGLLVGQVGYESLIDRSWAQGTVNGLTKNAGGIAGYVDGSSASTTSQQPHIRQSFADVTISPTFGGPATVAAGGIVGRLIAGNLEDVLSTGNITGDYSGGIIGALIYKIGGLNTWLRSNVTHAIVSVNGVPNRTGAIGYYDDSLAFADCRGVLYNTTTDTGSLRPGSTACQAGASATELRLPTQAPPDPFYFPYIFGSAPVKCSSPTPPPEEVCDLHYPAGSDGTWNFSAWALNSTSQYATLINIPWSVQPK